MDISDEVGVGICSVNKTCKGLCWSNGVKRSHVMFLVTVMAIKMDI